MSNRLLSGRVQVQILPGSPTFSTPIVHVVGNRIVIPENRVQVPVGVPISINNWPVAQQQSGRL